MIEEIFQNLSPGETIALKKINDFLEKRLPYPSSLIKVITQWNRFVRLVQNGYDDYIYEYINDLFIRNILQEIIELDPKPLTKKITNTVEIYDELYKNATHKIQNSLADNSTGWWWYRVPNLLTNKLKTDLTTKGYKEEVHRH